MKRITGSTNRGNAGMSLIELIVVLMIFGILVVIAVPRYLNLQQEARRAARDSLTGNLRAAAGIAYADASINGSGIINPAMVYSSLAESGGLTFSGTVFTATINGVLYTWTFTTPAGIGSPFPAT
jgi:MSHA pilin protein MshA